MDKFVIFGTLLIICLYTNVSTAAARPDEEHYFDKEVCKVFMFLSKPHKNHTKWIKYFANKI